MLSRPRIVSDEASWELPGNPATRYCRPSICIPQKIRSEIRSRHFYLVAIFNFPASFPSSRIFKQAWKVHFYPLCAWPGEFACVRTNNKPVFCTVYTQGNNSPDGPLFCLAPKDAIAYSNGRRWRRRCRETFFRPKWKLTLPIFLSSL